MTYEIPAPANATYVARATGRSDTIHTEVGSLIEQPKFVDNAVHHAIYETSTIGDIKLNTLKIKPPTQTDFVTTHQRRYIFSEEDSSLRVAHTRRKSAPFYNGAFLSDTSLPPLLIDAEDHSLRLKTQGVTSTTHGSNITLTNMRGKSLNDYGMKDSTHMRFAQVFSVGLRTTDLVQRLFKDSLHGLNSVGVGMPISNSNSINGENIRNRHSNTFVAKDFYATAIPTAIRSVARYDHYSIFHDRFGNFIYSPKLFKITDREIGQRSGSGTAEIDPIVAAANRIVVEGKAFALNDKIRSMIDDVEAQKKEGTIRQMRVRVPTATNETQARRSANQMLRLNRKAQGAMKSKNHTRSWDLQPGEVATYKQSSMGVDDKQAIIEVKHTQEGISDFQFSSYESGLEGVLNAFADDAEEASEIDEPDRSNQILTLDKTGIGRMRLKSKLRMEVRGVSSFTERAYTLDHSVIHLNTGADIHAGFIIGHRHADMTGASRGAIGSGYSKRIVSASSFSSTTITVASNATDGFPTTGKLTVNDTLTVAYTGITSTTFTGVSVIAPSIGTAIPSSITQIKLLRPRGHEMIPVKSLMKRRSL